MLLPRRKSKHTVHSHGRKNKLLNTNMLTTRTVELFLQIATLSEGFL